jgi:hypothetical protein
VIIITCVLKTKNGHKILVEKPEGNRPLGKPRQRWDNIVTCCSDYRFGLDWRIDLLTTYQ